MAFPVSNPFRFATNQSNWIIPTAARIISGWLGGDPVPAGEHDALFGTLTDWVTWMRDGVADDLLFPLGFADWHVINDSASLLFQVDVDAPFTGTDPINAKADLKNLATNFLKFRTTIRLKPGKISGASVLVTSASFDDCIFRLFVYADTGALLETFENSSISVGTMNLTGTATEIDGASYAIFEVELGENSGQNVEVSRLAVKWSAP